MPDRPAHDPRTILNAARSWQVARNADAGYRVTSQEACLTAAILGPLMLRPPSQDQVRDLLDSVGLLMDMEDAGTGDAKNRAHKHLAEAAAINAAWAVGGHRP